MTRVAWFSVIVVLPGCVRSVTVCATVDHGLQRSTYERPARDSAGASVCAEVVPPGDDH